MNKVAIIYWSQTGNTEMMAEFIAQGLRNKAWTVDLYTISDFEINQIDDYSVLLFGCPAMGDEVLEEFEFQPKFDELKPHLIAKKVGLFGSYDWGDGLWMREWKEDCESLGIEIIVEPLVVQRQPEPQQCIEYGEQIANLEVK